MCLAFIVTNIEVSGTGKFVLLFRNLEVISRTKKYPLKQCFRVSEYTESFEQAVCFNILMMATALPLQRQLARTSVLVLWSAFPRGLILALCQLYELETIFR